MATTVETQPTFGKKTSTRYGHTFGLDKQERIAKDALRNILIFGESLQKEIQHATMENKRGAEIDQELLERMQMVQAKHNEAMRGFREYDEARQRHVLMIYADAVQDLMAYMHKRRRH